MGKASKTAIAILLSLFLAASGMMPSLYVYADDAADTVIENTEEHKTEEQKTEVKKSEVSDETTADAASNASNTNAENKGPAADENIAVENSVVHGDDQDSKNQNNNDQNAVEDDDVQYNNDEDNDVQYDNDQDDERNDIDGSLSAPVKSVARSAGGASASVSKKALAKASVSNKEADDPDGDDSGDGGESGREDEGSDEETPAGEAGIGEKVYNTLKDAVESALDGAVIKLLKDIFLRETVVISGKTITIADDGKARTISGEEGKSFPLFKVDHDAELTIDGTAAENLKLQGGETGLSNSATAVVVEGVLNIGQVTIDGGKIKGARNTGAVNVRNGGVLNMSDGVIENTRITNGGYGTAAVVVQERSHFNMSGGEIRNNYNSTTDTFAGGGVVLSAWSNDFSTMTLSGGKIKDNTSTRYGGGIFMTGASKLHMTGGSIEGNYAGQMGGGVCVSGLAATAKYGQNEFIMDGGSVSYNRARTGGGIYVNSDAVHLNAGLMEGNVASMLGGAVYVSEVPRVLYVSKAIVTDNTAYLGGGLWACPTGSIHLKVTDGLAIYGNTATAAGDDVVNINHYNGSYSKLSMPDRMLGGGAVTWYQDGKIRSAYSDYGIADTSVARFDPEDPGEAEHFNETEGGRGGSHALKAVVSDPSIERAYEEATLIIRNNSARYGGGMGTNGDITLARMDYKDWRLIAEKKWEDVEDTEDKEVRVFLKIGDQVLDSVVLSKDNDWKAAFNELPDPTTLGTDLITVVEGEMVTGPDGAETFVETDKYIVSYERLVDEDGAEIYVTVTNRPLPPAPPTSPTPPVPPTPPEEPETPDTPEYEEPDVPEVEEEEEVLGDFEDDREAEDSEDKNDEKTPDGEKSVETRSGGVQTGDSSQIAFYLIMLVALLGAMTLMIIRRVRRKNTEEQE